MSWQDVFQFLQRIIKIGERVESLSTQVKALADSDSDHDRRLVRLEAKFEMLEHMGILRRDGSREQ